MSKAFTKEEDESGFTAPATLRGPTGPFHLTATGARKLAQQPDAEALLARADVLAPQPAEPERAVLGVTVHVLAGVDEEPRAYRLVSAEEYALLGEGCSVQSPAGRALLGARVGEVRELRAPRGAEELAIVALEGESR
jgi:transcription elongation GreA/GreB family factor